MAVEMDVSVCWSYDCSATFVQTHYLTDFWTEDHNILPYVPQKMNPNEFVHLPHCHQQVNVFCWLHETCGGDSRWLSGSH